MRRPFPPASISHHSQITEWRGFALEESSVPPNISLIEDQIDLPIAKDSEYTQLVEVVAVNSAQASLVQCGPITTLQHLTGLDAVITKLTPLQEIVNPSARKIICLQLTATDTDWESIKLQDYLLVKSKAHGIPIVHLCFSVEDFFLSPTAEKSNLVHLKTVKRLERLQNIVGLLSICSWIDDKFTQLLGSIPLDGVDEFPLEATLKDFSHQRHSPLLQGCLSRHETITLNLGDTLFAEEPSVATSEVVQNERELLELRIEMRTYLHTHLELLEHITQQINKIERAHPTIYGFKAIAEITKALLEVQTDLSGSPKVSFGQQLLQLSLLNALLGTFPIFNSSSSINHTNICSSIAVALIQLLESDGIKLAVTCALNWDSYCTSINKRIAGMGYDEFANWLRSGSESDELIHEARWISKLRQHAFKNLQMVASRTIEYPIKSDALVKANDVYLNFLPQRYVEYNRQTGAAEELVSHAKAVVMACFSQN